MIEKIDLNKYKKIKLKDLGLIFKGRSYDKNDFTKKGEILYLTGRNIQNESLVFSNNDKFLKSSKVSDKKYILKEGDCVITTLWDKRKIYCFKNSDHPSICSINQVVIRSEKNDYLSKYFKIEELYNKFELDCQKIIRGSVIPFLSLNDLKEVEIYDVPEKEILNLINEQKKELLTKNNILNSLSDMSFENIQIDFIKKLINEYYEDPILKLSKMDESNFLEFKSSLKTDIDHGGKVPESKMINNVIKTIGGFCNTGGGDLLIGVSDDNEIIGIEIDGFKNNDKFFQSLIQNISNNTNPDVMNLPGVIDITFYKVNNKNICRVKVEPTDRNIFVLYNKDKIYYKRKGPKTVSLDQQQMLKYVEERKKIF